MTTQSKKAKLEEQRKKKEEAKSQMPKPEVTISILRRKLKVALRDPLGYMISLDLIDIEKIHRVSYNVLTDELTIVFPETSGRIGMFPVEIVDQKTGEGTGEITKELAGQITSYKTAIQGKEQIMKFLKIWLNMDTISDEDFEGFKHHKIATDKIAQAAKIKAEQMEKSKLGLVDANENPVVSMPKR